MRDLRPIKINTARFYLKMGSINLKGEVGIELKLVLPGKVRLSVLTGYKVLPQYWDKVKGRPRLNIKGRYEQHREIYDALDQYANIAEELYLEMARKDRNFTRDEYREEFMYRIGRKDKTGAESNTLLPFFQAHIDTYKQRPDAKEGTWKKLQTVCNLLKQFSDENETAIDWATIDWNFRDRFRDWLFSSPRSHSTNTVAKVFEVIKQMLREGHRRSLHQNEIFLDSTFGIRRVKSRNKVRLSFEEIDQLAALDFSNNPRLDKVRDLFVLACNLGGPRFSDWEKLTPDSVIIEDGEELLQLVSKKTGQLSLIPLLPTAKRILEKYQFAPPTMSIQKFNDYIKEVAELALGDAKFLRLYSEGGRLKTANVEKWKHLSSHAARRSFCSNFFEAGFPAVLIMQVSGHSTEKAFFQYIDLDQRKTALQFAKRAKSYLQQRRKADNDDQHSETDDQHSEPDQ